MERPEPPLEPLARGEVRLRVHGPDHASDAVSAGVFSHQLSTLFRALKAADKATNGQYVHDFVIHKLNTSVPTAILAERPIPKFAAQMFAGHSSVDAFEACVVAVTAGERDRALTYGACVKQISKFSRVGYSEIWTPDSQVFRVDPFLREQAQSIVRPLAPDDPAAVEQMVKRDWYRGIATGSFDGEIKAVDLRGALPQMKLVLTAGGAEIDCVWKAEEIEAIRKVINRRARVYGRAIYDGKSGLPRRIEVSNISEVTGSNDFTRWRGSFRPFDIDTWEDDV